MFIRSLPTVAAPIRIDLVRIADRTSESESNACGDGMIQLRHQWHRRVKQETFAAAKGHGQTEPTENRVDSKVNRVYTQGIPVLPA